MSIPVPSLLTNKPIIYIITGEPSGDILAAEMMRGIFEIAGEQYEFRGIGGEEMKAIGFQSLFPQKEISLMGLVEVLPHIRRLIQRINQCINDIHQCQPAVIVSVDAPGFAIRVVKKLMTVSCPKVHYVAPTVWIWKAKRAMKFAKYYDLMLTLLPFEPAYFTRVGLKAKFVGHPVLERKASPDAVESLCAKINFKNNAEKKLIAVLPGSRKGELKWMLPIFKQVLTILKNQGVKAQIILPTLSIFYDQLKSETADWPFPVTFAITAEDRQAALAAADCGLATSGTVALELAVNQTPAVIGYKLSPITAAIVRRMINQKYIHLINIILDKMVVPECVQENCTAEKLADNLLKILTTEAGVMQISQMQDALDQLREPNRLPAYQAVAREVLATIEV